MSKYNFGTNNSKQKFEDILKEYEEYKLDETNILKASNLSSNLWHLTDWTFKEQSEYSDIGNFRDYLYTKCVSLKIFHDIANANKHKDVSRPKAKINTTKKYLGDYSNEFDRNDFDVSKLIIELEDGEILDLYDEIEKVVDFWNKYFN
ncbi:hypothetical protein [Flavobacterium channae]|uniref:hypothetical protein n=1 Tax=Flavobacterium channae TaxID=2897181 RepID=UPI001E3BCD0B|nr:hypothetical protein [Flavobacterium channae]UGS24259.1 hypothetical protein LOS89_03060 [Flavobacterium channae]